MPSEMTKNVTIRISDCDASGRWRPSSMLVEMQELGELHSASYNLSRVEMVKSGVCWILYRQHAIMHAWPTFGDEVQMLTWPGAVEGPVFPRYYVLTASDGSLICEGTTSWILMNIDTRRPMRPSALPGKLPPNVDRKAPLPLPGMLRIENADIIQRRIVHYSDLDVNGHMNNTRYVDWICDALDFAELNRRGLREWQINYISEAKPGEALELLQTPDGEGLLVQGRRQEDGRTVFESRIVLG